MRHIGAFAVVISLLLLIGCVGSPDIHGAAEVGDVANVEELLADGVDPNTQDKYEQTPLHLAALNGHTQLSRLLLEQGAEVNAKNIDGATPLHVAAMNGHIEVARFLLEHKGVDYEEIRIDTDHDKAEEMTQRSRRNTVPQIFIDEHHVGGYDDLAALEVAGRLDVMLGLSEQE